MAGIEAICRPVNEAIWMDPLRRFAEAAYGDQVEINERPSAIHLVTRSELAMQRIDAAEVDRVAARLREDIPRSFRAGLTVDAGGLVPPRRPVVDWFPLMIRLEDDGILETEREAALAGLARYDVRSRASKTIFATTVGKIVFDALQDKGRGRTGPTLQDYMPAQVVLGRGSIRH